MAKEKIVIDDDKLDEFGEIEIEEVTPNRDKTTPPKDPETLDEEIKRNGTLQ